MEHINFNETLTNINETKQLSSQNILGKVFFKFSFLSTLIIWSKHFNSLNDNLLILFSTYRVSITRYKGEEVDNFLNKSVMGLPRDSVLTKTTLRSLELMDF